MLMAVHRSGVIHSLHLRKLASSYGDVHATDAPRRNERKRYATDIAGFLNWTQPRANNVHLDDPSRTATHCSYAKQLHSSWVYVRTGIGHHEVDAVVQAFRVLAINYRTNFYCHRALLFTLKLLVDTILRL